MKDKNTIRAKNLGFRARSVFKLEDVNRKFNLIKEKNNVLDLGCWPGSWMQFCFNLNCSCVGIDLRQMNKINNCVFIKEDIYDKKLVKKLKEYSLFDVVLSDLAPQTTGIKELDQSRSLTLSLRALEIAKFVLKEKGNFLCKIFQSSETDFFIHEVKKHFSYVKVFKPISSKKRSKEVYIIAKSKHSLNV